MQVCCVDSDDSCSVASLPPTLQLITEDKEALPRDVQQPSLVKQPSPIQQSSPVQQPSLVGIIKPEIEFQPGTTPQTYWAGEVGETNWRDDTPILYFHTDIRHYNNIRFLIQNRVPWEKF